MPGVTLPFWDESSKASQKLGIPWVLTAEKFELEDGTIISNPLRSFTLPEGISDDLPGNGYTYSKPTGYSTVRYALSGLVGSEDIEATRKHNSQYQDHDQNVKLLNRNVCAWLRGSGPTPEHQHPTENGAASGLEKCLAAPNYTVFSNASSVAAWNANSNTEKVTSLEQPHNDIHLAVGGVDVPKSGESWQIAGANGDMGENNTSALDPIFFFHHCTSIVRSGCGRRSTRRRPNSRSRRI